jgi:hypothetical protein
MSNTQTDPKQTKTKTYDVTFTSHELHTLLRTLATANDSERTVPGDVPVNSWMAQRIFRVLETDVTLTVTTDAQKVQAVADAINATVALERALTAAGDERKRPKYERSVVTLLRTVLYRDPTAAEIDAVLR